MNHTCVILPNTLFEQTIPGCTNYILYEHPIYFSSYNFHKLKLALHMTTMAEYARHLESLGHTVEYVKHNQEFPTVSGKLVAWDPIDLHAKQWLLDKHAVLHESPMFIETISDLQEYYDGLNSRQRTNLVQTNFYMWQRKRLNVLMDAGGKPLGGSWTYDTHNRNPFDSKYTQPVNPGYTIPEFVRERISKEFPENPGSLDVCLFPSTHAQARVCLDRFIQEKLSRFGKYEDAMHTEIPVGNHSLLSSSLNIGLITPKTVLDSVLKWYYSETRSPDMLYSVEGFVRQLIGWRSFVRFVYLFASVSPRKLLKENYLEAREELPKGMYTATTGLFPVDYCIDKVLKLGYLHHIERLMILGNYLMLMQTNPKRVYDWFMELFIDSYEWVMIPNVMGMSQYATESIKMTTRPYFSASSYIIKMSDFKPKNCPGVQLGTGTVEWSVVWDALYYTFISKHYSWLSKVYATARNTAHWKRKSQTEKNKILQLAHSYRLRRV